MSLNTTQYPPVGKEYFLRGFTKGIPKLNPSKLEQMCKMTRAHPLIIEEMDIGSERIWYVLQSESHMCIRYDKVTNEVRVDDFTCGHDADPTNISPSKNPQVREFLNLASYKDNAENPLKRGLNTLKTRTDHGIHLTTDIYRGNPKKLNDKSDLENASLSVGRILSGTDMPDKVISYAFKDEQGNIQGYSETYVFSDETNTIIQSHHTYPTEAVWMGDVNSKKIIYCEHIPQIIQEHLDGKSKKWKVMPGNFLATR